MTSLDEFFDGHPEARRIYDALERELRALGDVTVAPSRSQIAFRRRHTVAVVWRPGRYLKGPVAPLVLTLSFPRRDPSPRWKDVVQITPTRFTHHLELFSTAEVDADVRRWLREAWQDSANNEKDRPS